MCIRDSFAPYAPVSREQMVTFLHRYAKLQGADVTVSDAAVLEQFPDHAQVSSWALEPFAWAVEQGIINGVDGSLAAADTTTRAQVVVMLHRFILAQ